MALDWSQCPAVESIPGKLSGAWVLRGTRMPVSVIFENLEAGANIDDIMNWFEGLDRNQVKAVIQFAVRSLDETPLSALGRDAGPLLTRVLLSPSAPSSNNIRSKQRQKEGGTRSRTANC
jgi:uncharacterized protein (DUF433 family)